MVFVSWTDQVVGWSHRMLHRFQAEGSGREWNSEREEESLADGNGDAAQRVPDAYADGLAGRDACADLHNTGEDDPGNAEQPE